MECLKKINYKRTFLNQVIIRLDFQDIISVDKITNECLLQEIQKHFVQKGIPQIARFAEVKIDIECSNMPTQRIVEGIQQDFGDNDGNKAVLASKFLIFELNRYVTYENHMEYISPIIAQLLQIDGIKIERTGIRYVNIFGDDERKIYKNYFKSNIAAAFVDKLPESIGEVQFMRSMNASEYQYRGLKFMLRYGMYNPDYPKALRKKSFALDFDCFNEQILDKYVDIMESINIGHEAVQVMFENSITDKLRKVLNE